MGRNLFHTISRRLGKGESVFLQPRRGDWENMAGRRTRGNLQFPTEGPEEESKSRGGSQQNQQPGWKKRLREREGKGLVNKTQTAGNACKIGD